MYSKMVGIPIKRLLQLLDQLSGDLVQLDKFVDTRDVKLLWSKEEDAVLEKRDDLEMFFLRQHRGADVVARRLKYLSSMEAE